MIFAPNEVLLVKINEQKKQQNINKQSIKPFVKKKINGINGCCFTGFFLKVNRIAIHSFKYSVCVSMTMRQHCVIMR